MTYLHQGIRYSDNGVFQYVQSDAPGDAVKGDGWARDVLGRGYVVEGQPVSYTHQGRTFTVNGALRINSSGGAVAYRFGGYEFDSTGAMFLPGTVVAALTSVASTEVSTEITVTGSTNIDISSGVFGVEYSINSAPPPYDFSVNVPGAVSSQSITIGVLDGIDAGDIVYIRAYYNLNPLDPVDTRVYGTPTLTVTVSSDGLLLGQL